MNASHARENQSTEVPKDFPVGAFNLTILPVSEGSDRMCLRSQKFQ